jgi:cytochrome P450
MFLAVHPEHVRQVSITNRKNYDKRGAYDIVRKLLLGNGLVTSTGEAWRRQRSLMAPYFTPRYIENYAEVMLGEGEELLKRWEILAKTGETVDMTDEMMGVTASIILKTMFSMPSGEELHTVREAVEYMIRFTTRQEMVPIQLPLWAPTPSNIRYRRSRRTLYNYIHTMIESRRKMPEKEWPNDLLSKLMLARDEETQQGMPDDLLRDELITIFFAGHETTAKTLTFLWYSVSQNRHVEARLHTELDTVLAGRLPTI